MSEPKNAVDVAVLTGNIAVDGARGIVEMLFCTSLIALVGAADQPQSSPRKLQIVNTKVCGMSYEHGSVS
jgi:hypothetical protein